MKQERLADRLQLLAYGEKLGYPRIGYGPPRVAGGRKQAIKLGQTEWEKFCAHAHTTRIPPALRVARILVSAGIKPFNPLEEVMSHALVAEPGNMTAGVQGPPEAPAAIDLDAPLEPVTQAPLVTPTRNKNALRQARYRERKRNA